MKLAIVIVDPNVRNRMTVAVTRIISSSADADSAMQCCNPKIHSADQIIWHDFSRPNFVHRRDSRME